MTAPAADGLREARRLLAEVGWTQHESARNAAGRVVYFNDPSVTCFCISGAMAKSSGMHMAWNEFEGWDLLRRVLIKNPVGPFDPIDWNDAPGRTKAEVLDLFDRAIALAEAAPGQEGGA